MKIILLCFVIGFVAGGLGFWMGYRRAKLEKSVSKLQPASPVIGENKMVATGSFDRIKHGEGNQGNANRLYGESENSGYYARGISPSNANIEAQVAIHAANYHMASSYPVPPEETRRSYEHNRCDVSIDSTPSSSEGSSSDNNGCD